MPEKMHIIVDGRRIAKEIEGRLSARIKTFSRAPVLAIVSVGDDPVISTFVGIKRRFAHAIGVVMREEHLPSEVTSREIAQLIGSLAAEENVDGIVLQLPIPDASFLGSILPLIPSDKDPDVLSPESVAAFARGENPILPPVAAAIKIILDDAGCLVVGRDVLVVGHGKLVGAPAALFFRHQGVPVTVVDRPMSDLSTLTREADIIISGVGRPGLITPDMLTEGVILIDAGTSEASGKVVGDTEPSCASKAFLYTPVPGGIGPVTVAALFQNLMSLAAARHIGDNKR